MPSARSGLPPSGRLCWLRDAAAAPARPASATRSSSVRCRSTRSRRRGCWPTTTGLEPLFQSRMGGRRTAEPNPMFEEHREVPRTRSEKDPRNRNGGPQGIRTRVLVAVTLSQRIVARYVLFSSEKCGGTKTRRRKRTVNAGRQRDPRRRRNIHCPTQDPQSPARMSPIAFQQLRAARLRRGRRQNGACVDSHCAPDARHKRIHREFLEPRRLGDKRRTRGDGLREREQMDAWLATYAVQ